MKYALLIYADEAVEPKPGTPEGQQYYEDFMTFTKEISDAGINAGGEALTASGTATTVRVRSGETVTTDGPFAETKEVLGGFYLVDCEDLDAALEVAARIPTATFGSIEVRPIVVWD
jgi:hypothetical protein